MPSDEKENLDFSPPEDPYAGLERARPQHYAFAYSVLPQFVYWDPIKFQQASVQNEMSRILRHLWDQVATEFPVQDQIPSDELQCLVDEFDGLTRVIVIMPTTKKTMEAEMLGICISADKPGAFNMFKKSEPEVHIFALERSYENEGQPMNMIGVFSKDRGRCGNLGQGPKDVDGFKLWIAQHIREIKAEQKK